MPEDIEEIKVSGSFNNNYIGSESISDNTIKNLQTVDNKLLDMLGKRNLLPEGFKEYMFEKYKDQDFSTTGYFDLINIIDSELADFIK